MAEDRRWDFCRPLVWTGAVESSAIGQSTGQGHRAAVQHVGAQHPVCLTHFPGTGERGGGVYKGRSPLPSRQQLPSALCTKPPWTNGPDVCSASTFWAGALLRDGIPREAAVPAAEPGRSAGGDAAAQEPLDEGRPMWEITQKAAAEHRERHAPHLIGKLLKQGERGQDQEEALGISRMRLIWREVTGGFHFREITLKRDVSVSSSFPLLGPQGGLTWLIGGEQLACAS